MFHSFQYEAGRHGSAVVRLSESTADWNAMLGCRVCSLAYLATPLIRQFIINYDTYEDARTIQCSASSQSPFRADCAVPVWLLVAVPGRPGRSSCQPSSCCQANTTAQRQASASLLQPDCCCLQQVGLCDNASRQEPHWEWEGVARMDF